MKQIIKQQALEKIPKSLVLQNDFDFFMRSLTLVRPKVKSLAR